MTYTGTKADIRYLPITSTDLRIDPMPPFKQGETRPLQIVLVVDFKGFYSIENTSTAARGERTAIKTAA
jgi:hypothetical protein